MTRHQRPVHEWTDEDWLADFRAWGRECDARVRRAKRRARAGLKLTDFERDVIADYRAKQED